MFYDILGNADYQFSMEIEADSPEEAKEKATDILKKGDVLSLHYEHASVDIWDCSISG